MNLLPLFSQTDEELAARAARGDVDAENTLFTRHLEGSFAFARRLLGSAADAEDAVGEAFLKAHAGLRDYRRGASFRTWLYTIVHRAAIDVVRRRGVGAKGALDSDEAADPRASSEDDAPALELLEALNAALDALPPKMRAALHLRIRQSLSYAEIARVLETSEESARVAVFEGRKRLEQRLRRFLPESPDVRAGAAAARRDA